jgi:hypothetical protein
VDHFNHPDDSIDLFPRDSAPKGEKFIAILAPKGVEYPEELQPRVVDQGTLFEKLRSLQPGRDILVTSLKEVQLLVDNYFIFGLQLRALLNAPGGEYSTAWVMAVASLPGVKLSSIDDDSAGRPAPSAVDTQEPLD